jgi:hypothetical protein
MKLLIAGVVFGASTTGDGLYVTGDAMEVASLGGMVNNSRGRSDHFKASRKEERRLFSVLESAHSGGTHALVKIAPLLRPFDGSSYGPD